MLILFVSKPLSHRDSSSDRMCAYGQKSLYMPLRRVKEVSSSGNNKSCGKLKIKHLPTKSPEKIRVSWRFFFFRVSEFFPRDRPFFSSYQVFWLNKFRLGESRLYFISYAPFCTLHSQFPSNTDLQKYCTPLYTCEFNHRPEYAQSPLRTLSRLFAWPISTDSLTVPIHSRGQCTARARRCTLSASAQLDACLYIPCHAKVLTVSLPPHTPVLAPSLTRWQFARLEYAARIESRRRPLFWRVTLSAFVLSLASARRARLSVFPRAARYLGDVDDSENFFGYPYRGDFCVNGVVWGIASLKKVSSMLLQLLCFFFHY